MVEQNAEWLQDGVDGRRFWIEGIRSVVLGGRTRRTSRFHSCEAIGAYVTRELAILERMLPGLTGEAGGRSVE